MPTTREALEAGINEAVTAGFRGRLLDRGEARAMIWRDGQLPEGSPPFANSLSYDLHSYAYSLLSMGLRLRESNGDEDLARRAFEHAAMALESTIINGPSDTSKSFHFVIAGAAYHLARFSARAYSIIAHAQQDTSFSPIERCLCHLLVRNFALLQKEIIEFRTLGAGRDESIVETMKKSWEQIDENDPFPDVDGASYVADALGNAIIDTYLAGLGLFVLAIERGEVTFLDSAIARLKTGLEVSEEVNLLPQWWTFTLTIHIIRDLWSSTFHERLPLIPNDSHAADWAYLRRHFISLLFCRPRAEIDLWPSQLDAAERAVNESEDLVVSLPTSAGKTRIAELCILRCLASGRRVVFVTPLRALSAQTEATLLRTFVPLGKTISALYGSIGTSDFEEDALGSRNIVVATPEKLDFALRNNPALLDDVGLIVLDEGHMIGLGEREVRYEAQIQRLLKRTDAASRRIVCLSAILPEGQQLDDFVAWLSQDGDGGLVKNDWRPTRLRYGEITWANNRARLDIRVSAERPFVPTFFQAVEPQKGNRKATFPKDHREFVLATTWHYAQADQTVLIYCPERRSVEPYAKEIVKLHKQGFLPSVLGDATDSIKIARAIGKEWLGEDHPILKCLELGVAIHHGALPTPFRKEVERLLRDGILKITVSSPTLAQGLNLAATVIILHGIIRFKDPIKASEFRNVVGRAGRAFVDVEGLVLFPVFQPHALRRQQWEALIAADGRLDMESGLLRLVVTLLVRMRTQLGVGIDLLAEYVLNNATAWNFPVLTAESAEDRSTQERLWNSYITTLDTALLSLMGDEDIPTEQVPAKLDELLSSSLWERRLTHRELPNQLAYKNVLYGRAKYLWQNSNATQRRSYFLAGVGYVTGTKLDAVAATVNDLLVAANGAILNGQNEEATASIVSIAESLFEIAPFVPDPLPVNWRDIIRAWLNGLPISDVANDDPDALRFIEDGLVYRLSWGMDAVRVRAIACGDTIAPGLPFDAFETRLAVPAVEVGTLNRSAAILMQAGFTSRLAAIKAISDTEATFEDSLGFRTWLKSEAVIKRTQDSLWPTTESSEIWRAFLASFVPSDKAVWKDWTFAPRVSWIEGKAPQAGAVVRVVTSSSEDTDWVLTPDHELLGSLLDRLHSGRRGVAKASIAPGLERINIEYVGPADLTPDQIG